ncbi:hypothetical protein ACEN2D_09230 [Corynebacterium auriscanis]|uniref:hypothetical protein n=1 Tax=Corynebacterium auriscanis TaxID=99807 RepID=UPI003CF655D6
MDWLLALASSVRALGVWLLELASSVRTLGRLATGAGFFGKAPGAIGYWRWLLR